MNRFRNHLTTHCFMQCAVYTFHYTVYTQQLDTCKRNHKVRPLPPLLQACTVITIIHTSSKHLLGNVCKQNTYQWMNNKISRVFGQQRSSSATGLHQPFAQLKKLDVQMDSSTTNCESRQKSPLQEYSHVRTTVCQKY